MMDTNVVDVYTSYTSRDASIWTEQLFSVKFPQESIEYSSHLKPSHYFRKNMCPGVMKCPAIWSEEFLGRSSGGS